ncbi:multidrug effflux MFS transporter [Chryseosolibacter indicus]|uniref:Multidrug effflux MFS transporter n=1 Tax=Chryseosolibacter indicus TaxID=2782351 RepID=A0ABS5VJT4_9BACT|nr:multidrug effflux MFS transporter [Chryseosolibacter indicus]MBT1701687.1 multidrug effflux MFS transporter [Chryseosolibacter indicus]
MKQKQQAITILILGSLSTISPFSIDMYLPGFPAIAKDLSTSIANVQLSLTSYFIGIAGGQLLYGPLLDKFGRKLPLYTGLAVYIIASLACALTASVESLITMRLFQALGGCAGMVAAQTLVRDLFPVQRTANVFSWMTLVVAVSPMIAPTVGGFITTSFGWHAVFITLALVALVILLLSYFVLEDGRKGDKTMSLKPKPVINNFISVIKEKQFLIYCVTGGLATSAPFAYIAGSSDVFINFYHTTEQEYGWIFAIIGGVMIGCTQLNHILLRRFKSEQVVNGALIFQTIVGIVLITGTFFNWWDKIGLIAMIALFVSPNGVINANTTALSLAPFVKNAGSAASLVGALRMTMGGITTALVSAFHNGTPTPMVIIMFMTVIGGLIVLKTGKIIIKYRAKDRTEESVII